MQNSWQNKLPEVLKIHEKLHVLWAVEYCHAPAMHLPRSCHAHHLPKANVLKKSLFVLIILHFATSEGKI
jgi:hypothetical protein